jgi:hypothetical protein
MNKFAINDGGRSKHFKGNKASDCVIRSIAIATESDYLEVMKSLFNLSFDTGYMPNDPRTYSVYLESKGWKKQKTLKKANGKKYLVSEFPADSTAIIHTTHHLTTIKESTVLDTWDCREWCANSWYIKTN